MSSFLLRDVRIFTGEETIENGFVYVHDGKIASVGNSADRPDINVKSYSKPGHTILPGLIDAHMHADFGDPEALPQALRFGVTTVCEMNNELVYVQKLKKQTLEPDTASYKTAGQAATIENGWPIPFVMEFTQDPEVLAEMAKWPKLTDRDSVIEYLDWMQDAMQPDYIKLFHESGALFKRNFEYPTVELQRTIIEESHKRGYLVVAHATSLKDTLEVLEAGVDGMAHTFFDQSPTKELIETYKKSNAWVNPTLAVIGSHTAEGQELQHKFAHDPRVKGLITEDRVGNMCQCVGHSKGVGKVEYAYENVKALRAADINILCGSDSTGSALGTAFGLSLHHELHLFVHKIGMTPEEAIRSATSLIAKCFRFHDRGHIAEGLNADLLLVEGNPLEDIDATLNIRGVWRDGKLCSTYAAKL